MKKSISVIIPAFNEEQNIGPATMSAIKAASTAASDFEIILVDDGSTDQTLEVMKGLAKKNTHVKVVQHKQNSGFGVSIRDGLFEATKDYVVGFPGDNDTSGDSLSELIKRSGEADLIISYTLNDGLRSWKRQLASKTYVILMNILFGMHLRYFNGSFVVKTTTLKNIPLKSQGLTIYAEAKVRLIKQGATYREVPFIHIGRKHGVSKATSLSSIWSTFENMIILFFDMHFPKGKRQRYG